MGPGSALRDVAGNRHFRLSRGRTMQRFVQWLGATCRRAPPRHQVVRLQVVRLQRGPLLGDRVIPLADRRVSHRSVAPEFPALLRADDEPDVDPLGRHVATVESIPRVGVLPPLGQLGRVTGGLGPVEPDPLHLLYGSSRMHMTTEQEVDRRLSQGPPQALPMGRVDREVPVVPTGCRR